MKIIKYLWGSMKALKLWSRLCSLTLFQEESLVRLTSFFICLDLADLVILNEQQIYLFGQIQTSQTGGQPYSDTSPCEIG